MSQHLHTVDVARPIRSVYHLWTQFEGFPVFMQHVEAVTQLDDTHTHWVVEYTGVEREFDATITEQVLDERVAWTTGAGPHQAGVVTFQRIDDDHTRVTLQLDFDPDGFLENVGDRLGFVDSMVQCDLEAFRSHAEGERP